ncbi:hypothetical protein K3X44_09875 [Aliiroseovarius crassostreae]|uniref:LexA family transcriptional regulator n=1 Tax=Aliiroseovarius crassostreae TaxID=154981 RepID=UPI002210032F|nr:S24 family peptidase [Aliiroseovarius crassostreae]UWQ00824.1 hypothetical protein K3X44_09875 [Aliiroseovarius crassostreae]
MDVEKLVEIIETKRKALGMSMADVHKIAFPGTQSTAIQNLKRGTPPNLNTLTKLIDALGLELYIGPPRTNPAPVALVQDEPFDTVPRYDAASAAGNGVVNFEGPPIDHLAFSKIWLEQNGINAGACVLINVKGDSMEPSIYDGDLVMIDRSKTTIRTGQLYVFRDDDTLRLKRLDVIPDTAITLRSDNPKYPPEPRTDEAMNAIAEGVVGEVVWSGHKWV